MAGMAALIADRAIILTLGQVAVCCLVESLRFTPAVTVVQGEIVAGVPSGIAQPRELTRDLTNAILKNCEVSAIFPYEGRIAMRLRLSHIGAHEVHGSIEGASNDRR